MIYSGVCVVFRNNDFQMLVQQRTQCHYMSNMAYLSLLSIVAFRLRICFNPSLADIRRHSAATNIVAIAPRCGRSTSSSSGSRESIWFGHSQCGILGGTHEYVVSISQLYLERFVAKYLRARVCMGVLVVYDLRLPHQVPPKWLHHESQTYFSRNTFSFKSSRSLTTICDRHDGD